MTSKAAVRKIFFEIKVSGICLPYVNTYSQPPQWSFSSLCLKICGFFGFWLCWFFVREQELHYESKTFRKTFFLALGDFCLFLPKIKQRSQFENKDCAKINNYFQLHQWSIFLLGLKDIQIFLFLLMLVWESKGHNLEIKHFKKNFLHWRFYACIYLT